MVIQTSSVWRKLLPTLLASVFCSGLAAKDDPQMQTPAPSARERSELQDLLEKIRRCGPDTLWTHVRSLQTIKNSHTFLARHISEEPELTRIGMAKALCDLQDYEVGLRTLFDIFDAPKSEALGRLAGEILDSYSPAPFSKLSTDLLERLRTRLKERLTEKAEEKDGVLNAKLLWKYSSDEETRVKALDALTRRLASPGQEEKYRAALALGEISGGMPLTHKVVKLLSEIEHEPGQEGEKAALLLRLNRVVNYMVRDGQFRGKISNPLLEEIRAKIQEYHVDEKLTQNDLLIENAARGMMGGLDRFSSYMGRSDWAHFKEEMSGKYAGVGAMISKRESKFIINKVFHHGPAFKAGVRSRDELVTVGDKPVKGLKLSEVVKLLRGKPDSEVSISTRRGYPGKILDFSFKRRELQMPSVKYEALPGKIGYIHLTGFGDTSAKEMRKARDLLINKFQVRGLILDLRGNPGGLLKAAQEIASMFLEGNKLVCFSEGRNKKIARRKDFMTVREGQPFLGPMVVLVNHGSASAAEIVSGALDDHGRAILIGEKTYGKGSVQQIMPLDSTRGASALRLTIAKYYLPSGRCIHEIGIKPKISVSKYSYSDVELDEVMRLDVELFERYYWSHWPQNKELFRELAVSDGRSFEDYPEFLKFYKSLRTTLPKDLVRFRLRREIRAFAADNRDDGFRTDLADDQQLRRGIAEIIKALGLKLDGFPQYK